jgi:predicted nucleic acid-binding protein
MPDIVIPDTSPLYYLHRAGALELLRKLYGKVTVPRAVIKELGEGKKQGEDVPDLKKRKGLTILTYRFRHN